MPALLHHFNKVRVDLRVEGINASRIKGLLPAPWQSIQYMYMVLACLFQQKATEWPLFFGSANAVHCLEKARSPRWYLARYCSRFLIFFFILFHILSAGVDLTLLIGKTQHWRVANNNPLSWYHITFYPGLKQTSPSEGPFYPYDSPKHIMPGKRRELPVSGLFRVLMTADGVSRAYFLSHSSKGSDGEHFDSRASLPSQSEMKTSVYQCNFFGEGNRRRHVLYFFLSYAYL